MSDQKLLNFPPFYTKQPNEQTWEIQQSKWIQLVLNHCRTHKIWTLSPKGDVLSHSSEQPIPNLFKNDEISRSLEQSTIELILTKMVQDHDAEYLDKNRTTLLVYWNKPEIWGSLILQYVERNGLNGSVLTFMDLIESDSVVNEEFYQIHEPLLVKSLENLQRRGRAQLMKDESGAIAGVKIQ